MSGLIEKIEKLLHIRKKGRPEIIAPAEGEERERLLAECAVITREPLNRDSFNRFISSMISIVGGQKEDRMSAVSKDISLADRWIATLTKVTYENDGMEHHVEFGKITLKTPERLLPKSEGGTLRIVDGPIMTEWEIKYGYRYDPKEVYPTVSPHVYFPSGHKSPGIGEIIMRDDVNLLAERLLSEHPVENAKYPSRIQLYYGAPKPWELSSLLDSLLTAVKVQPVGKKPTRLR